MTDSQSADAAQPITQIDFARAGVVFESAPPSTEGTCTMCGKMCAMKTVNDIMDGLVVDLDAE